MSQDTAVLFANEAFYAAFAGRDAAAMDDIWAARDAVTCLHPGWPPLHGREAVMQSWRDILANPDAPDIRCDSARPHVLGEAAYVVCAERLPGGELAATNVFVHERGIWKMVHHQSAPAPMPPAGDPPVKPPTLQ